MRRRCGTGYMGRFDFLVVGAGFAGSVCARQLAEAGKTVLVIDQRDHVAGNAYDERDRHGILVHRYGAHIFHTNDRDVFAYLSRFTAWRPYEHRVLSATSRGLLPVPINQTTLAAFRGDEAAARAEMIVPYTQKQWGPYADQLLPSVLGRIASRPQSLDDRYFTDTYQAMPVDGYTVLVTRLLAHPGIEVRLRAPFRFQDREADQIVWSGPIDQYFNYCYGRLPYRSAQFVVNHYPIPQFQKVAVVNYPDLRFSFTRVCEFKHLTGQAASGTTVAWEFPSAEGEPFWPVPTVASQALYAQYAALAQQTPRVHFVGRLGTYRYVDMHQAVAQALKLSAQLLRQEAA